MFKWFGLAVILSLFPYPGAGQSVGLVLSGGGSKGLAHIGVIRALEEEGIPIDYVAGTSMGAIIGSLYAMGLTTDEMIEIVESEEFSYWISGELQEQDRYFFKQEYPEPDLVRIGLDLKDTLSRPILPMSLIPNQLMDFAFMEIYGRASAAAGYDFDSLFVPFLCNAADISNSKEVIFRTGDLSQAVRASMTVPLYFRPIVLDGSILYDGGIYNNFPKISMDTVFRPDVVIGSKAAEGNEPPDEFDILKQIENIVMKPADYNIEKGSGILIDMEFQTQSLLAFDKLDEFVDIGYRATTEAMDSIRQLVPQRRIDTATLSRQREAFRNRWPEFRFRDLEFTGLNERQISYFDQSFHKKDSVVGIGDIKTEYLKLANDQSLVYLYPQAVFNPRDSLFKLKMRVIPGAPFEAKFGLFISTTGMAQTYLGFSYRQIQEVGTHLKGSLQFGRLYDGVNLGFRFDYPLRRPVYFTGEFNYNRFDYNTSNPNFFFEDLKPSFIIENEINFRFETGTPYSGNNLLKGGLGIGRNQEIYYMTTDFTTDDTSDVSLVNKVSIYGAMEKNTLDNKQFAVSGTFRKFSLRAGYGNEVYTPGSTSDFETGKRKNYYSLRARFENTGYIPLKNRFSLGTHVLVQATFKPLLSNYYSTMIEAPVFRPNLVTRALLMEEYRAHQFIAAGLMPAWSFGRQAHVKFEAYAFVPVQKIIKGEDSSAEMGHYFQTVHTVFNASLNFITVAGPVSLHAAYLSAEEDPWVLQLSFGYLLFNRKSSED